MYPSCQYFEDLQSCQYCENLQFNSPLSSILLRPTLLTPPSFVKIVKTYTFNIPVNAMTSNTVNTFLLSVLCTLPVHLKYSRSLYCDFSGLTYSCSLYCYDFSGLTYSCSLYCYDFSDSTHLCSLYCSDFSGLTQPWSLYCDVFSSLTHHC